MGEMRCWFIRDYFDPKRHELTQAHLDHTQICSNCKMLLEDMRLWPEGCNFPLVGADLMKKISERYRMCDFVPQRIAIHVLKCPACREELDTYNKLARVIEYWDEEDYEDEDLLGDDAIEFIIDE